MRSKLLLLLLPLVFIISCKKKEYNYIESSISGQILVFGLYTPIEISKNAIPKVELYASVPQGGGDIFFPVPDKEYVIASQRVNDQGEFNFNILLDKNVKYFLRILDFDTTLYVGAFPAEIKPMTKLTIYIGIIPISWVIPHFYSNTANPGDTFYYLGGIGGWLFDYPFPGITDTIMPWVHRTWGGEFEGAVKHHVQGRISRQGVIKDTSIYYFVPYADTTVVKIEW